MPKPKKPTPTEKRTTRRDALWPDAPMVTFSGGGWAKVPRTVPLIATLIDHLTTGSERAGRLYVALWAHDFGEGLVEADPENLVLEAGYARARADRTWNERIEVLLELGFIRTAERGHTKYGFVLLLNPHPVVHALHLARKADFPRGWYSYFTVLCADFGISLPADSPKAGG